MRRTVAIAIAVAAVAFASLASGDVVTAVVVKSAGLKRVRVEVSDAPSLTLPCDASDNRILYRGWIEPGEELKLASASGRICWRRTSEAFPEIDWLASHLAWTMSRCRQGNCQKPPAPIRVTLSSTGPG